MMKGEGRLEAFMRTAEWEKPLDVGSRGVVKYKRNIMLDLLNIS